MSDARTLRLLHVSDLHFGKPCIPDVIDAMEERFRTGAFDVVVISGDVSQRSLSGEFQRAAAFMRDVRRTVPLLIVPGNHDTSWWMSPLHIFGDRVLHDRYQRYVDANLEPVLQVDGARVIGVNTSHGVAWHTLTTRPRDVSIIGSVTDAQLDRVAEECRRTPAGDVRIVVMHHNPVRGQLSHRFGITRPDTVLSRYAAAGVDLVLCGHDHQEAVHHLPDKGGMVVCTAGTLSNRSRGGRPCSFFEISLTAQEISVVTQYWSDSQRAFAPSAAQCFARSPRDSA